jgi:hypothetical protein
LALRLAVNLRLKPFFQGFKQLSSVSGLFEGTQKSDWKPESILEMENRFRPDGIVPHRI